MRPSIEEDLQFRRANLIQESGKKKFRRILLNFTEEVERNRDAGEKRLTDLGVKVVPDSNTRHFSIEGDIDVCTYRATDNGIVCKLWISDESENIVTSETELLQHFCEVLEASERIH